MVFAALTLTPTMSAGPSVVWRVQMPLVLAGFFCWFCPLCCRSFWLSCFELGLKLLKSSASGFQVRSPRHFGSSSEAMACKLRRSARTMRRSIGKPGATPVRPLTKSLGPVGRYWVLSGYRVVDMKKGPRVGSTGFGGCWVSIERVKIHCAT